MSFRKARSTRDIQDSVREKIQQTEDVIFKEIYTKVESITIFYVKTLSDETQVQDLLIKPLYELKTELFLDYLQSHPKIKIFEEVD